MAALLVFLSCFLFVVELIQAAPPSNILMILIDDQDVLLNSLDYMPKLTQIFGAQGIKLSNMFATTPVCCPSRSSLLTGKYIHNIPMTNNTLQGNCSSTAFQQGAEKLNIATYMKQAGYRTGYFGKYLNCYGDPAAGGLAHVPPGWDNWCALQGNSVYYNYSLSVNGTAESHGDNYATDYLPQLLANRTMAMISDTPSDQPFFIILAPPSCHDPTEPAPQYSDLFVNLTAPRTPNYNNYASDKNFLVQHYGNSMTPDRQFVSDWQYRRRIEVLQTVDDIVEAIFGLLEDNAQLDNTYIFYTADNGYHFGQFGLLKDKRTPYEFDVRVPGFVFGPGLAHAAETDAVVTMLDYAPTFLDIAGMQKPADMDGTSMLPSLHSLVPGQPTPPSRTFLVEYSGESGFSPGPVCQGVWAGGVECFIEGPDLRSTPPVYPGPNTCSCQDTWNNTYSCVRTLNGTMDTMYCTWIGGWTEYYDVGADMWQRVNSFKNLTPAQASAYTSLLDGLRSCVGADCLLTYPHNEAPDLFDIAPDIA